jgi:anti-sigma-K factor RskA
MNATRHIEPDDLALYAMQLLAADEASVMAAHLERCEDCRKALAEVQGDLAVYAHTVDLHSPPAQARERLMKQVGREKKTVPIDRAAVAAVPETGFGRGLGSGAYLPEDEAPRRSFGGRVLPWVGWALAAGLAVTAGNLYQQRAALRSIVAGQSSTMGQVSADAAVAQQVLDTMTDSRAKRVTLTASPQPSPAPQGRVTYVASKGTLIFLANNLQPLQPAKVYELWLIPSSGAAPIPAGMFHPDAVGNASVMMPPLPKGVEAKAFGVTIENEGGADKPTLPIILVGA